MGSWTPLEYLAAAALLLIATCLAWSIRAKVQQRRRRRIVRRCLEAALRSAIESDADRWIREWRDRGVD